MSSGPKATVASPEDASPPPEAATASEEASATSADAEVSAEDPGDGEGDASPDEGEEGAEAAEDAPPQDKGPEDPTVEVAVAPSGDSEEASEGATDEASDDSDEESDEEAPADAEADGPVPGPEGGFREGDQESTTRVSVHQLPEPRDGLGDECLVVLYGGSIGRKYDIGGEDIVIGRDPDSEISLEVDSVSRKHARIINIDDQRLVVDAQSTNGTYVNDRPIDRHALVTGDLIRIGDVIFKYLTGQNIEAAYHEEIYRMTISDGLTSVANVRYLNQFLEREFARSRRYGRHLSVLMLDIDRFKRINDELGHLTGDYVLREIAALVGRRVRREELLARYGGEEFVLVLPETGIDGAVKYAEALRQMVELTPFLFEGNELRVTVSIGIGAFDPGMARPMDLIRAADEKLYEAKRAGRNRVMA